MKLHLPVNAGQAHTNKKAVLQQKFCNMQTLCHIMRTHSPSQKQVKYTSREMPTKEYDEDDVHNM